jgi:MHS family metabolite:H+ symporter-like MFS transporter
MGIQLGTVAAALIYALLLVRSGNAAESWIWRLPFLLSVVIVAVAIWIRLRLKESPSFAKLEARHEVDESPLVHLLQRSRKNLLIVVGLRMAENGGSSMYQSLAISYMVAVTGLNGQAGSVALLLAGLTGAAIVVLAGVLSDGKGRVPVYRGFALYQLALAFPMWWMLSWGDQTWSIIAVSVALVSVWGMFGIQGAFLPELFGARHRYAGVATGREVSAVFAGGIAPLIGASIIAWATSHYGGGKDAAVRAWIPLAGYVALLSLITFATTFVTPETRGRDLDDLRDAGQQVGS